MRGKGTSFTHIHTLTHSHPDRHFVIAIRLIHVACLPHTACRFYSLWHVYVVAVLCIRCFFFFSWWNVYILAPTLTWAVTVAAQIQCKWKKKSSNGNGIREQRKKTYFHRFHVKFICSRTQTHTHAYTEVRTVCIHTTDLKPTIRISRAWSCFPTTSQKYWV